MQIFARVLPRLVGASVLSVLALCSCAAEPPTPAQLAERIDTLIGDAACDSSSQCRTIAIGARACGGPDSYRAWSTRRTDQKELSTAVQQHAERRRAENVANRMASICVMATDPGASCRAQRCSLNPVGLGQPASGPD